MFLPLSLLKNYLPLDISLEEIVENLTDLGIEVEKIENENPSFSNIIAAEVTKVEKHPSADKLQIATVFDGKENYQVVCGAPNCRAGLKTAFAPLGATLADEKNQIFKIKKAKLRGVESFGMLCSGKELNISSDSDGIMDLKDEIPLGADIAPYFHDPILELSLTPNLGHCLSVIGIARELAAGLNQKIKYPAKDFTIEKALSTASNIKVTLEDPRCLRYSGLYLENVSVGPSPDWLVAYLEKSDFKSINNLVDITNFILLETGQPLHAFDTAKIANSTISIEKSKQEDSFLGLNGVKYKVPKDTILIKDAEKILALGGILGGESSAVSANTKNIFLESACFEPLIIRKSCHPLQLRTESSLRFEKATDPNATIDSLKRAAHLIQKICPEARVASDFIDLKKSDFPEKTILLKEEKVNRLLGVKLSLNEIASILERLELKTKKENHQLQVSIPTFRNDLNSEIDLIEEVARVFGYNKIEKKIPFFIASPQGNAPFYLFEQTLKNNLVSQGLKEIISPDLISPKLANITHEKDIPSSAILAVKKAKSQDNSVLRPTLLPSHLQIIKQNHDYKNFNLPFFEISKVHLKKEKIIEEPILALTISGNKNPHHFKTKATAVDFFDLKGYLENLLASLNISQFSFAASDHSAFHPGQQAHLMIGEVKIATLGAIHPQLLQKFDLKKEVYFAEINTHLLFQFKKDKKLYHPLPTFPASARDWTLTVKKDLPMQTIFEAIEAIRPALLERFYLLDLYSNEKLKDQHNLTLRFVYRDLKKTISFKEVESAHAKIIKTISKNF